MSTAARLLRRRDRPRYSAKETGIALLLLAPSIAVFVAFFYRPFLNLLNWGTFESRANGAFFEDVGLRQYREQLTSDDFREGLWHSVQFVLYTVPAGLVLGILLAVAAHRRLRGIKAFQAIFSSTLASSVAVTSVIFFYLLNPVVGIFQVDWLTNPDWAMFAVSLSSIWQNMGLSFIIVLAGLQNVPDEVVEAATLDGYGPVRRLLRITLPLISPVLLFLLVVLVIFGLQAFAQVDILTGGGPAGATETLVFKINRLVRPDNIGIGAVYSVGLFFVTLVVTAAQFVILERRVHYAR
ncbi:MAG TPA: sugar ABC transporter permease [Acidimicrobiales bacterium]|nr:sugar ABC transporter permease [Acidimicrobiales bacterium]